MSEIKSFTDLTEEEFAAFSQQVSENIKRVRDTPGLAEGGSPSMEPQPPEAWHISDFKDKKSSKDV